MAVVRSVLSLFFVFVTSTWAAPSRTFDQRQQGDLNIHAQLDNIVVVVIPSARLNLLDLAMDTKFSGDKGGFFQLLQKLQKTAIDRYDNNNKDETSPHEDSSIGEVEIDFKNPFPVITSTQQFSFKKGEKDIDKEEEVVATVEEMKPEPTEKTTQSSKSEATEDRPVKEQSTFSEKVQDSVAEEPKDTVKEAEKGVKESSPFENDTEKQQTLQQEVDLEKKNIEKSESPGKETHTTTKIGDSASTYKPEVFTKKSPKEDERTIEDYIKPVASKEVPPTPSTLKKSSTPEDITAPSPKKSIEPVRLQEGVRKEKVIRYKPEAKWAPELVDFLGPPKPKPKEIQERQMFADLCSPGAWDPELRTCIMPGETRSRSELARFLNAMRFGIAVPK